jgi:MFS family permease
MRRVLVIAASVIFFDTLLYGILIPLTPVYAEHLGVSKATIGVIFALYGIPLILFSAPLGILADRLGRTPVLRGAMALLALATAVFALATRQTNIALLVVARLVQGTAAAATWATAMAMVTDLGRRDGTIAQKMLWVNLSASGGTIAGPFIGGLLAGVVGAAGVFVVAGGAAVVLALLIPATSPPTVAEAAQPNPFVGAVALLRRAGALAIALVLVLLNGMLLGLNEILAPFALRDAYGASSQAIGLVFAAFFIGSNCAQPVVARWSDRTGRLRPMRFGGAASVVLIALLIIPMPYALFIACFGLVGMAGSLFFTPLLPLITEAARGEQTGMLVGTANTTWSLGYLIGPALGGVAAAAFGRSGFLVPALAAAIGLAIVLRLWRAYPAGRVRPMPLDPSTPEMALVETAHD